MVCRILPGSGRGTRRKAVVVLAALALPVVTLAQPAAAGAAPAITLYNLNSSYDSPDGITEGPDGNMWFTEFHDVTAPAFTIGEITPAGTVTDHPVPAPDVSVDGGIAVSPDQRALLYAVAAQDGYIGRMTTEGNASILQSAASPQNITAGPHGSIWYTSGLINSPGGSIVRISRGGKVRTWTGPGVDDPYWITEGPHGTMWFTNGIGNTIGRITPCGHLGGFTSRNINRAETITRGPGGMWYTNSGSSTIGRITMSGHITTFRAPGTDIDTPFGITRGPDGAMWFTNFDVNTIGRITTSGQVTTYKAPGIISPAVITPGPGGTLWFTNSSGNSIGEITFS